MTYKAERAGYHPSIILAGRRLNDSMAGQVVSRLIKAMIKRNIEINGAKVLVMGLAFKEDCRDLRNTKVTDIINELHEYGVVAE